MAKLLQVQNVSKIFGGEGLRKKDVTVAVDDVTFSIADDRPTITAIAGESGSGKSTLALLMMGQIAPNSGQVMYRGKDLARMTRDEKSTLTRELQPIYQDPYAAYNPFYRVDHVLQMPIKRFGLASSKEESRQLIEQAMEKVGLRPAETLGRFPHQLSGGQKQRLMVARALLCQPKVVMADEPVSMVDASLRATILSSLRKLKQDFGISILYITHDLTTAYQISENILIMYAGSVVEAGSVEQVIRKPKHPYTQLLVSSIPLPDKNKRWGGVEIEEVQTRKSTGCKFAPRCPMAMEECWSQRPAFYTPDQERTVACFLYKEHPTLPSPDVSQVFPSSIN
ncbi:MAG: ABC transporter ATP-binding protein [Caldilineaceae bacterium]